MTDSTAPTIWPCLAFKDARAAVAFLVEAFGFEERAAYSREDDPSIVEHGELRWTLGAGPAGIMFGSAGKDDSAWGARVPGNDALYLVCDDPDALYARATAAGAEIVRELRDEHYGSRGFSARDPEGNLWSFGTYRGE